MGLLRGVLKAPPSQEHIRRLERLRIDAKTMASQDLHARRLHHAGRQHAVLYLVQGVLVGLSGNLMATAVQHFLDKVDWPTFAWRDAAWTGIGVFFLGFTVLVLRAGWRRFQQDRDLADALAQELGDRGGPD